MATPVKVTCLECGNGYEIEQGTDLARAACPKCHTPPTNFFPYAKTLVFASPEGVEPITLTPATGTPATAPPLPAVAKMPDRIGKYEILSLAGKGGMGVVYRARHSELNRTVALKVMVAGEHATEETIQRFQREARSAATLQHSNIVGVYDVGQEGSLYYFVMEFVDGVTLDHLIRDEGVRPEEAARIVRDLSRALDYAHRQDIIHRDIKPSNIMVDRHGLPKLADFGLAKSLTEDKTLTKTGEIIGTACYMPPEQASGSMKNVDGRSDIYALGTVLYEMLTRRPPFGGDTVMAIIKQVEESDPLPPSKVSRSISRDLETICLKAMAKEKERRYPTAGALADDLDAYLTGSPISARPSGVVYRAGKWARRNPAISTAVGMGLVAAVLIGMLGYRNWQLRNKYTPNPEPPPVVDTPYDQLQRAKPHYDNAEHEIQKASAFSAGDRPKRRTALEKAVQELNEAIRIYPKYADAYYERGVARAMLAQPGPAISDFTQAIALDPQMADAYYARIRLRIRALRDRQARGHFFQSSEDMFERERELIRRDVETLKGLQTKKERAYVAEARYLMTGKGKSSALGLADKAIEENPAFADAYVVRAWIRSDAATSGYGPRDEEGLQRALLDCTKAIGYEVNNQEAYRVRAAAHLQLGDYPGALKDLEEMVAIAPDEAQTYIDRAMVLENDPSRGRSRDQIAKDLDRAIQLDPRNATGHFFKAVHLLEAARGRGPNEFIACRDELDAALDSDPGFTSALVFRMVCDLALGDEPAFEKDFERFTQSSSGVTQEELHQIKTSIRALAGVLREEGTFRTETEELFDQALSHISKEQYADAERKFREVLKRLDDPGIMGKERLPQFRIEQLRNLTHYNLACIFSLQNDLDRAIEELESALKGGYSRFDHMARDPDLENLRKDPRYAAVVERYRKK